MTYTNVLVAVEPNDEAASVLSRAREIAPLADISVLTVLPDVLRAYGMMWSGDATAAVLGHALDGREEAGRRLRQTVRAAGITPRRIEVRSGDPAPVVRELAAELGADCIVAGCHGQHGIQLVLGSTANALIHGLDCDAYMVRVGGGNEAAGGGPPRKVVIAVDATEDAHEVVEAARALTGADTHVTLMTVVRPAVHSYGSLALPALTGGPDGSFEKEALGAASVWLDAVATQHGLDAERLAVVGSPADRIRARAQDQGADLIVVGSHGRHGLGRLLGSTANGVLHSVTCDVLVARVADR